MTRAAGPHTCVLTRLAAGYPLWHRVTAPLGLGVASARPCPSPLPFWGSDSTQTVTVPTGGGQGQEPHQTVTLQRRKLGPRAEGWEGQNYCPWLRLCRFSPQSTHLQMPQCAECGRLRGGPMVTPTPDFTWCGRTGLCRESCAPTGATHHSMSLRSLDIIHARSNINMADCKEEKPEAKVAELMAGPDPHSQAQVPVKRSPDRAVYKWKRPASSEKMVWVPEGDQEISVRPGDPKALSAVRHWPDFSISKETGFQESFPAMHLFPPVNPPTAQNPPAKGKSISKGVLKYLLRGQGPRSNSETKYRIFTRTTF